MIYKVHYKNYYVLSLLNLIFDTNRWFVSVFTQYLYQSFSTVQESKDIYFPFHLNIVYFQNAILLLQKIEQE